MSNRSFGTYFFDPIVNSRLAASVLPFRVPELRKLYPWMALLFRMATGQTRSYAVASQFRVPEGSIFGSERSTFG